MKFLFYLLLTFYPILLALSNLLPYFLNFLPYFPKFLPYFDSVKRINGWKYQVIAEMSVLRAYGTQNLKYLQNRH